MSRHHILPPIVYTPAPPKPKETRRRRSIHGASAADDVEESEEAGETIHAAPVRNALPLPQHKTPVEAAERRTPSTTGNLRAETLKALLDVQEQDAGDPTSTPKEEAAPLPLVACEHAAHGARPALQFALARRCALTR